MFDANKLLDTYCGSPFYAAPEMVTATPYRGPPVDMWSCGVILYAMLTGQLPFHCDTMPELFRKISLAQYTEPDMISEDALNLIKCLLCRNPKRRITAEAALKHAWFDENFSNSKKFIKKIPSAATFRYHHIAARERFCKKHTRASYPYTATFDISSSPTSALPSPIVSVGDEELASYKNPTSDHHQKASKATRFLLHALNKKSQVAPSRENRKDGTGKKGSKAMLITAERIKRFFSTAFIQRRLTTT
jgi:serine/threonine protein kinase